MTTYCACETPVMDVEHDSGCRRCGRPVDFSPQRGAILTGLGRAIADLPIDEGDEAAGDVNLLSLGGEPVATWPSRDELRDEGVDPDTGVVADGRGGWVAGDHGPAAAQHEDRARSLMRPLREAQERLHYRVLRRISGPGEAGRLTVEAIEALGRAESACRTLYTFDPTGL